MCLDGSNYGRWGIVWCANLKAEVSVLRSLTLNAERNSIFPALHFDISEANAIFAAEMHINTLHI
jgi:hypothetical protein